MIVATLLEPSLAGLRAAVEATDDVADAFEIRLDALAEPVDATRIRALTVKPLIATCRRAADGGTWRGDEAVRLKLLEDAARAGCDFVDVEVDAHIGLADDRIIRSQHDFDRTLPAEVLAPQLVERGASGSIVKHASRVRSFSDTIELLATSRRLGVLGIPASIMGLGDFPRALTHLLGGHHVYGGARRNAPGQPAARDLAATLKQWGLPRPATQLLMVVGRPVDHSLSPRMHNAALRHVGLDASYGALEVSGARELARLLHAADDLGLRGLSVTSPLKGHAFRLVDSATEEAQLAQSVNTIRVEGGRSTGHVTDGMGARRVLEALRVGPGSAVLVVGAGGAARGLVAAMGDREVFVAARRPANRRRMSRQFGVETFTLDEAARSSQRFDVFINATSVEDPLPVNGFDGALFDLHYSRGPTAWQGHAAAHGNRFAGGRQLLVAQGIDAFEFWTGTPAPLEVMESAVAEEVA